MIELSEKGKITDKQSVVIIVGSNRDLVPLQESRILKILDGVGVRYEVSVISAHRNPKELRDYCAKIIEVNRRVVVICVAGMSAALPGVVASHLCDRPVIGVALSSDILNGQDAMYAMARMPSGTPVAFVGINKAGLENAAYLTCRIIGTWNVAVQESFFRYLATETKEAQIGVILSE